MPNMFTHCDRAILQWISEMWDLTGLQAAWKDAPLFTACPADWSIERPDKADS